MRHNPFASPRVRAIAIALVVSACLIFASSVTAPAAENTTRVASTSTASIDVSASIDAYRGLGTWVDIHDNRVFNRPATSVREMKRRGVRTIFVETSNSTQRYGIKRPKQMAALIRAAHARGMYVVAWYLPTLRNPGRDLARCQQAIAFRTSDGQAFDSFALDIECTKVKPVTERTNRLLWISENLRSTVGSGYPLGAIIPSPAGMQARRMWQPFPYAQLAATYDVILPMSYYTYHGDGGAKAYADTLANMSVLRAQPGCAEKPVHLIGGIASRSSRSEVRNFVRGSIDTTSVGASVYDFMTTKRPHWLELAAVNR